ncbi:growth-regulating factor 8 isoform X2 [Eutrema salsugineum]|uniref:growth-regulating factor 8 isoform X2 n=1 Tax=Eutrema salsugineum TaxID=72664 RepID=UPI000CED4328|nr:growth-regulating factor 8 isoform X2 [Eutrema salsugineum]
MGTRAERNKEDFGGGFGFGVVEHSHKDVMVLPHHHHHHQYPSYSSPSSASLCYYSAGVGDSMFSASSNQSYTSSLGEMFSLAGSNSAAVSVADPFFTLSSSGEMGRSMSEKEGAAFSEAQWQELERQRNIYKYMMASVPVPSELLTPIPKNPSNTNNSDVTVAVAKGSSLKLGIASNAINNAADMEPWRCKRTDGKKWRCSRNVIPDQKYCERHTHKSRPRSRKPVESSHHNDFRAAKNDTNQLAKPYPQFYGQPVSQFSVPCALPSASSSYDHHRWFMKEGDAIATLSPAIHEAAQVKVGSSRELKRGFNYDLNFRQKEPLVDQSFGALQGLLSPNQTPHNQETRRFFVERDQDEAMGSSLTLSMAGGAMEEAEGTNQHQWISHEGPSWLCSTTPGGPLAEALCLGVSNNPSTSNTSSCSRSSS